MAELWVTLRVSRCPDCGQEHVQPHVHRALDGETETFMAICPHSQQFILPDHITVEPRLSGEDLPPGGVVVTPEAGLW